MLLLPSRPALHPGAASALSLLVLTEAVSIPHCEPSSGDTALKRQSPQKKKKKATVPEAISPYLSQVSKEKGTWLQGRQSRLPAEGSGLRRWGRIKDTGRGSE